MSTPIDGQARGRGEDALQDEVKQRSLGDNIRLGGGIALLVVLALFFVQNLNGADVNFLWFDWNIPLFLALALSAALGAAVMWLFTTFRGRAERKRQEEMFESALRNAKNR